ncbi:MAG: UDP-N-acetylmuramoylalanyl-D-glutamyl-2,6-diaminopimelate--D-alanyl-D-alanine ligase [Rhodospirillales bacterium]
MTRTLWTSADAEAATGGRGTRPWRATGVSIDSRTLAPGDLFVALAGERGDGHTHVAAALAGGAAAALVTRRPDDVAADAPLLVVPDSLEALTRLGLAARARATATRGVAVTGSVGKTGTKDALRHVLGAQAPTHGAAASFNNHIGVPVTLARLPRDARYAVYEIGMNHAGEIAPLVRMVRPAVAVITTVAPAHVENFADGIDGVARAKSEIFAAGGETAIVHRDIPHYESLAAAARARGFGRVVAFGAAQDASVRLTGLALHADRCEVEARIDGRTLSYRIGAPGRHWAVNSLAVLAAAAALGADVDAAAAALADMAPPKGRGLQRRIGPVGREALLIDESYNANPASMRAALAVTGGVRPAAGGRRIAVLGDMFELGPDSATEHAALCDPIQAAGIDLVFTCGARMRGLHDALPARLRGGHAETSAAIAPAVVAALRAGDVVMVKGSLAAGMQRVVDALLAAGDDGAQPAV